MEHAALITETYGPISVRGVCYKLFVQGLLPSMAVKETQKISRILVYARENGIVDWEDIVDETRQVERAAMWDNLPDFAATVASAYRRDFWTGQDYNVQIWSEKATVGGILRPVTEAFGVPFMAVHGFSSATAIRDVAIASAKDTRRDLIILYCGDWDPSGMYMSEVDIPGRLKKYGGSATIRRIALTSEDLPGLPSFSAKQADPRYKWFRSRFGEKAWELDAMDPNELRERVEAEEVLSVLLSDPTNLSSWLIGSRCTVEDCDGGCWRLSFSSDFPTSSLRCSLPAELIGKTITWSATFIPYSPSETQLVLQIVDNAGTDTVHVALRYQEQPVANVWTVRRMIRAEAPFIELRNACSFSRLAVKNICMEVN